MVQWHPFCPTGFRPALLAAMLERRPVGLISALKRRCALTCSPMTGTGCDSATACYARPPEWLRGPLARAMERQAATVLLESGAPPCEVAAQLARSAGAGREIAIDALRHACNRLRSMASPGHRRRSE